VKLKLNIEVEVNLPVPYYPADVDALMAKLSAALGTELVCTQIKTDMGSTYASVVTIFALGIQRLPAKPVLESDIPE